MSENSGLQLQYLQAHSFFFIIGRSRSGTTLLRTILDSNPEIAVPNECTFILQLSRRYSKIKKWDSFIISKYIKDLQQTWLFEGLKVDINALTHSLSEQIPNLDYALVCKTVLSLSLHVQNKETAKCIGDKNPSYSLQFNDLYKFFGNTCKYVTIIRDYRDQFVSLRNTQFEIPNIYISTKRWVKAYKAINSIKSENILLIKYEDLISEPEKTLDQVCRFLGVLYNEQMLDFYKNKNSLQVFSEHSLEGIHKSITNPLTKDKISIWPSELSKNEIAIADRIAKNTACQNCYKSNTDISFLKFFFITFFSRLLYLLINFSMFFIKFLPLNLYLKYTSGAYLGNLWSKK